MPAEENGIALVETTSTDPKETGHEKLVPMTVEQKEVYARSLMGMNRENRRKMAKQLGLKKIAGTNTDHIPKVTTRENNEKPIE